MQEGQDRHHHFFLFRHCVRTTWTEVNLGINGGTATNVGDLIGTSPPNWNAPDLWCTETGLDAAENTGRWLLESQAFPRHGVVHFQVVADPSSHRDIETACAVAKGISKAAKALNITTPGLNRMHYEKQLFDQPSFVKKHFSSDDDLQQAAVSRLRSLPHPDLSPQAALQLLRDMVGNAATPLFDALLSEIMQSPNITLSTIDQGTSFIGPAEPLLKWFAKTIFYARASNVPFLTNDYSDETVYELLQFLFWFNRVLYVGNPDAACRGAMQAVSLLKVLRDGFLLDSDNSNDDDDLQTVTRVTILVGHDTDLHALATALDARWTLNAPYRAGLLATPPMSGIHVKRKFTNDDDDDDTLSFEFLYPVYSQQTPTNRSSTGAWITNTSGILESTKLLFDDDRDSPNNVDQLKQHFANVLSKYSSGSDCFRAAHEFHEKYYMQEISTTGSHQLISNDTMLLAPYLSIAFWVGLLIGALLSKRWQRRGPFRFI